jgi:hypothetical protein
MSCNNTDTTLGPIPVWTKKSTSNKLFFAFSAPVPTNGLGTVRMSMELENSTGDVKIEPAMRTSQDGQSWDTAVAVGTQSRASDGTTYGDDFVNIGASTSSKQLAQFGLLVSNNSGGAAENAMATLRVEYGS